MNNSGDLTSSTQGRLSKPRRSLRILVVDDDRDTVLSLMMLLREEAHDVHGVYCGREVMSAVMDCNPDVVILDINLPDRSGWEVARMIHERRGRKRPMLIGISGEYKRGSDKVLADLLGFDHYLVKPYAAGRAGEIVGRPRMTD
jgi:DNA-binding response OmpR family regulator